MSFCNVDITSFEPELNFSTSFLHPPSRVTEGEVRYSISDWAHIFQNLSGQKKSPIFDPTTAREDPKNANKDPFFVLLKLFQVFEKK